MARKPSFNVRPSPALTTVGQVKQRLKKPSKGSAVPSNLHTIREFPQSKKSESPLERPSPSFDPCLFLTRLNGGKTIREYREKEVVFSQGDTADAVYYIQSGQVQLTVLSKRGKEAVVAVLREGNFFGEGCLAGQPLRMSTATVIHQRCTVTRVEKSVMLDLLHKEPEFAARFLAYLLSRNIRMESDLVDHLFNSSEKRLARLLLLLANFGQESKPIPVVAKMSQETLAEMIGTTRSRVSFFMNRFRRLGFIEYDGDGMRVHSSLVSVVIHDE